MQQHRRRSAFPFVFAALALLAILPLWVGEYMPMVDVPQHAAQLSIGQHWQDPEFGYQRYFHTNWMTNQLFAYSVVHGFMSVLPLVPALKCTLSLALLGVPLAAWLLLSRVGGDRWWSLAVFPVAYNFCFYWGFLNFIVTIPLGLVFVALAVGYAKAPSTRRALLLAAYAHGLFFAHVLVLAYSGLIAALIILARAPSRRDKLIGCGALASILPAVAAWWATIQGLAPSTTGTPVYGYWGWHRVSEFLSNQVGIEERDPRGAVVGALLLLLPFAMGARPTRERWRWIPFGVTVFAFFVVPLSAIEVDLIYGRFAVFALPTLLFALDRGAPREGLRLATGRLATGRLVTWRRAFAGALVAAQLASLVLTFRAFDAEARSLDPILAAAEPHKRVLYLPTSPASAVSFSWPYSHFGQWYQVKRGGLVDFSFAEFFPMWYRYKPEQLPGLPDEFDWRPQTFRWGAHHGERFDYLLVRGPVIDDWFEGDPSRVYTVARHAEWTLLGVKHLGQDGSLQQAVVETALPLP
ncbi:MAG TPA: hypothetical protein VMG12_23995 [Polyangiaceae bacterium]|nr:hypothetical protein [Polyangiaceae bacterium]